MTGREDVLIDIDRSITAKVAMGTGQLVDVIGKGSLMVETKMGKKYINEVLLVSGLKENLLSVGQMMEHGYFLIFGDNKAEIYDDCTLSNLVARNEDMVLGLSEIKNTSEVSEGCTFGKHCRKSFPKETTSRATTPLELVHTDVYKSEVFNVFKKFKATVELQSGYKLKKLRSDRGEEYTSNEFNRFCDEMGMERQLIVAYSPQQNDVAERKNRTIVEMTKSMMFEKSMPLEFWAEAVNTAVCEKGYRLYNLVTGKVIISRDVVFNEDASWDWNAQQECSVSVPLTKMVSEKQEEINDTTVMQAESSVANDVLLEDSEEESAGIDTGAHDIDHTPLKYKSLTEVYERCNICIIEPETFEEAIKDASWKMAMDSELEMIEKNDTWELVKRSSDKPVVGVKWIYKVKLNLNGSLHVKSAFLNGVLHEEVYVDQPPGFVIKNKEDRVYRLKKALYGLKQATKAWYEEINSYFTTAGFQRSPSEATLYVKTAESGILIVSLYVDDIIYTGSSKDLSYIFLHKKKYARTLLDKFGFKDCKAVATPLAMNEKLSNEDGSEQADERMYRQIVGSLLYLTATRLDIMFAASLLARYMHRTTRKHMGTAKRVLRYIQGVFSWASAKQSSVALSTTEAENVSASEAIAQAVWLRFVLSDFGEEQVEAIQILCDNTSAIAITKNPVHHHKTRHINRRFHFIRDALKNGEIDLLYCRTGEQNVDILTKALARDRFEYLKSKLGVISAKHLEGSVKV
ncbi:unnamed protein product [Prunus brigantina]